MGVGKEYSMANKEQKYVEAKLDLLKAKMSLMELTPEQQRRICYEVLGVSTTEQMLRALRK